MNRSQADIRELQFCRLLDELYAEDVTQGDTTRSIRATRCRLLINRMGQPDRIVRRGQTLGQAFEAVYGEPLIAEKHEANDGV